MHSAIGNRLRHGLLAIAREAVRNGTPLPGEHELARRLDANRPQVRQALAQLEYQGIVQRQQGTVTKVDPLALRMTVRLEDQLEHSELLDRLGFSPSVKLLEQRREPLGAELSDALQAPADTSVLRARKVWLADGRPAMIAQNTLVLPESAATDIDASRSAFDIVAELWNEPIVWEVATPGVENIGAADAETLALTEGSACMTLTIIGVLRSGRRVFHALEHHDPDIVRYSVVRRFPDPWS